MAKGVQLGLETSRRIVHRTRLAEATPTDKTGRDVPQDTLPRDYRQFELTAELSGGAGSTAAVKWLRWDYQNSEFIDSGDTGEVLDATGNAWGISGDRGEAVFRGGQWIVHINPGQPVYRGKLDGDLDSGDSATMSVWRDDPLADSGVNITVHDPAPLPFITAAKKIAIYTPVSAIHISGKWYLEVPGACEVAQ